MDWQKGDLALCQPRPLNPRSVDSNPVKPLRPGMLYMVKRVARGDLESNPWTALVLEGAESSWFCGGWCTSRFQKVEPVKDVAVEAAAEMVEA